MLSVCGQRNSLDEQTNYKLFSEGMPSMFRFGNQWNSNYLLLKSVEWTISDNYLLILLSINFNSSLYLGTCKDVMKMILFEMLQTDLLRRSNIRYFYIWNDCTYLETQLLLSSNIFHNFPIPKLRFVILTS